MHDRAWKQVLTVKYGQKCLMELKNDWEHLEMVGNVYRGSKTVGMGWERVTMLKNACGGSRTHHNVYYT